MVTCSMHDRRFSLRGSRPGECLLVLRHAGWLSSEVQDLRAKLCPFTSFTNRGACASTSASFLHSNHDINHTTKRPNDHSLHSALSGCPRHSTILPPSREAISPCKLGSEMMHSVLAGTEVTDSRLRRMKTSRTTHSRLPYALRAQDMFRRPFFTKSGSSRPISGSDTVRQSRSSFDR